MKLLDNKEIKKQKDIEAERIRKLKAEEVDTVKRINTLQEEEKKEKARVRKSLSDFKKSANDKKLKLQKEIVTLKTEITELEKQKMEAMKPIDAIKKEAEKVLEDNMKMLEDLNKREASLNKIEEDLEKGTKKMLENERDYGKRMAALDIRAKNADSRDDAIKRAHDTLNAKKAEFDAEFKQKARYLIKKEAMLTNQAEVNKNVRIANEEEKERLNQEQIQIADKYTALAQATNHLKKYGNSKKRQ